MCPNTGSADPSHRDPRIGTVLQQRYRVVAPIAAGGMGAVYRGERLQLGRPVAIKFLHPGMAANADLLRRFELEAQAMSRLSHPNCVSVFDFGVADAPYLVMDYVGGKTLRLLMDERRVSASRALEITRQLLAGLAHAHKQEIIHRDVKPGNVMIDEDVTGAGDRVRILDFGLAKLRDEGLSVDGSIEQLAVGTPSYMPPEQIRGQPADGRSDLYSVGVILFELLSGRKPFVSTDTLELLRMQGEQMPPRLADASPDGTFSEALEYVIARALAKDPVARFQNAQAFQAALAQAPEATAEHAAVQPGSVAHAATIPAFAELAVPDTAPPTLPPPPALEPASAVLKVPRRRPWPAVIVVLGLVASTAAWWHWSGRPEQPPDSQTNTRIARIPPDASTLAVATADASPDRPLDAQDLDAQHLDAQHLDAQDLDAQDLDAQHLDAQDLGAETLLDGDTAAGERDLDLERLPDGVGFELEVDEPSEPEPQRDDASSAPDATQSASPRAPDRATKQRPRKATLARVEQLVRGKRTVEAIRMLRELRARYPQNPYYPLLMGHLYCDLHYYGDGITAYLTAVKRRRRYARSPDLIRNTVDALASRRAHSRAAGLLVRYVGRPARPYLRRAAKRHPNKRARQRAAYLLRRIR